MRSIDYMRAAMFGPPDTPYQNVRASRTKVMCNAALRPIAQHSIMSSHRSLALPPPPLLQGVWLFDVFLPADYPSVPPQVGPTGLLMALRQRVLLQCRGTPHSRSPLSDAAAAGPIPHDVRRPRAYECKSLRRR
jgi:hypothetical protein